MRIATWNCSTGLAPNWKSLENLEADVLTVQECGRDAKSFVKKHEGWTCEWQVGRVRKGVSVLARYPFGIEETERSEPCTLSTVISGPNGLAFRFVGFWAMTPNGSDDTYPQQATDLIGWLPQDDLPIVLAGDFNASARNAHHLRNVAALKTRNMVSAYHAYHGIAHTDPWEDPTSYHHWNKERPHHMDYIFIPALWGLQNVEVGSFEDFPAKRLSDHVPLIATVSPLQEMS